MQPNSKIPDTLILKFSDPFYNIPGAYGVTFVDVFIRIKLYNPAF